MGRETIRRANTVHRVTSLQLEYSLMSRGIEATILPTMRELHISATAYGVLSRGLLAGKRIDGVAPGDIRTRMPRWRGENLERNLAMVDRLAAIARQKNATPTQLAMAWVLSRGADIVPLAGARTRAQLQDLLGALNVSLSADDLARIEAAVPAEAVAGARYDEHQMAMLDSER
jgi:aryl-alcohol dehydrogenase-like predicted oxidoreductase